MHHWPHHFVHLRRIAQRSPHPTEKIAAQLLYVGGVFDPACFNARPALIDGLNIPHSTKIADRSLYVHAETRALLNASRATRGATLLVTDPFCPNCAKQIAQAGIARVIVDEDGFGKRYFSKNKEAFEALSLSILAWAGVHVFIRQGDALTAAPAPAGVIQSMRKIAETVVLPVTGGWTGRWFLSAHTLQFEGPAFTPKYDARIDALSVVMMKAKRKSMLVQGVRTARLSDWPSTPRAFIDALDVGLNRFEVASQNAPDWAGALKDLGIVIA